MKSTKREKLQKRRESKKKVRGRKIRENVGKYNNVFHAVEKKSHDFCTNEIVDIGCIVSVGVRRTGFGTSS